MKEHEERTDGRSGRGRISYVTAARGETMSGSGLSRNPRLKISRDRLFVSAGRSYEEKPAFIREQRMRCLSCRFYYFDLMLHLACFVFLGVIRIVLS